MNYAGKFDGAISSDGPGNHSQFVHLNPGHVHAPADAIVVPDAHFLFNADFKRSGVDLILSSEDHELVLHEYFKGAKHKALASPDGAHLTGELVDALTGHVEIAQAGGAAAAASAVIGHITKLAGSATVIRNGVSIILNMGDNVEKGDVVQSGSNTTVGITFIDGTVFGLSSNAKMVLNDMVYDPNGSNNSSLLSLVSGTMTFVAGETAKHGDMKIDTPVATMGIRGTAVLVEIDFSVPGQNGQPNASFQVLVEPDGTTGSYILFDKATMQPLAIVNQAGQQININNGVISQTQNPLSPEMQKLITDVFQQKFTDNTNTKQNTTIGSSFTDNGITVTLKYADNSLAQTTAQGTGGPGEKPAPPSGPGGQGAQHVAGAPTASFTATQLFFVERPGLTGSSALDPMKFTVSFADPNPGDSPTVRADFTGFTLKDAAGHDVLLSPLAQQDVLAAEIDLNPALVAAAGNANNGSTDVLYSLADKDFDFLAQGQSLTLSYVITVNNNYGPNPEVTKQTVTFTIFGTNDVPVIADDKLTQLIEFAAGTGTPGGTLTVLHGEATGGTYDFKDPDLTDTHWIIDANKDPAINPNANPNASDRFNSVHKAALTSASLTLPDGTTLDKAGLEALAPGPMFLFEQALDVDVTTDSTGTGNGKITWQLENLPVFLADFIPAGETLKLYYTIEVTDENGATDTKVVEVDITGTNAAATVWVHTTDDGRDGNWTTGANWGTGKAPTAVNDVIIVTDQLHPHTPAYPATITTGTNAAAHSVVMNDFVVDKTQPVPQTIPPELKLETGSSLTIGTDLDLSADSILTNAGTVTIDGKLELLDDATNPVTPVNNSVIINSGTINIGQGGDIQGLATVTNSGTIELKGGTLNLDVNVANTDGVTGGNINVDSGAKLVLGTDTNPVTPTHGGVTGGTVTVRAGGELDLTGGNTLRNGTLTNQSGGQVNVTGTGNVLDDVTISNTGSASAIDITGALTLQDGTTLTNTDATSGETVDGGTLTLNQATISNGQIINENDGILTLQANGRLDTGLKLTNTAQVNVSGTGNVLDDVTISNTGSASAIDITGALTLQDGTTLTNTDATSGETVDGGTLTLNQATISNGQIINENGGILTLQANGRLDTALKLTNTAQVNVSGPGNVLDDVTVSNTGSASAIDITGALTLQDGTTLTNADATSGATVDGGTLTLNQATVSNGQIINENDGVLTLQANGRLDSGLKLTNTAQVDVTGANNVLDNVTVSNTGSASAIDITGALTLQDGTTLANQNGTSGETVDGGTLTLNQATISNGQIINENDGVLTLQANGRLDSGLKLTNTAQVDVTGANNVLDNVTVSNAGSASAIDITGALTLQDGTTLTNTDATRGETVESGGSLTMNGATITGGMLTINGTLDSAGTNFITGATIDNTSHIHVVSGTLTIDPAGVTNTGTIEVEDSAKLVLNGETVANNVTDAGVTTNGTIQIDGNGVLGLEASTVAGGNINVEFSGKLVSTGDSFINGTTITNAGLLDVTDGTLTIDATSILNNTGNLEADGGNLVVNAAVSGNLEIHGGSQIELGAIVADAYSAATVTFDIGSTGTLKLDNAAASKEITIVGLDDDNTIDFTHLTYESDLTVEYTGGTSGGTLSILHNGVEVSEVKLTGDYTGVHWVLGQDSGTGTTIVEAPGAIISGLDAHGNAVEDQTLTVAITDIGQTVTNATYRFETYNTVTHVWEVVQSGSNNTYTPDEQDEGKAFKVDLSFTDVNGDETSSVSAGTVQESSTENASISLSGLTGGNAVEGQQITATVTEADAPASGITYTWKVNGATVKTGVDAAGNTYAPTENDEGQAVTVSVSFTDTHGFAETGSTSAGTVQESPTENASIVLSGLTSGNAVEHQQITATVTEADAPASGITYTWKVNGTTVKTGVDAAGNTYTPSESDEGKPITVSASFTDTHGFAETGSTSAGIVQESPTENAAIVLSGLTSGNAVEGQKVTATVTEADAPASGITYTWKVNGATVKTGVDATGNTYTPTEGDEGKAITVAVAFIDSHGLSETGSTSAGTVQESPTENASIVLSGLTSGNAVEGQKVTATVAEADAPASGITYTWMVNGATVKTGVDTAGNTYTPTEGDEGKPITVSASFTDTHGFSETGSISAGTVQESPTENASISLVGLTNGNAVQGQLIAATVTEGDAPSSGITYTWKVNGVTVKTGVDAAGNTYTPTEGDEGKPITVAVAFIDTHGFSETGTQSAGTVQDQVGGDLVATLDHTSAQRDVTIHVTNVTDGGIAVTNGISYAWQQSTDGGQHWTTVGTGSSFTPGDAQEGKLMQVVVTYADATGTENATYNLGTPSDLSVKLDSTTAQQGLPIHVTSVIQSGNGVSVSYAWQTSIDGGQHWITVGTNTSYTPVANDDNKLLQLVVTYVDFAGTETGTASLGIVAAAKEWTSNSSSPWDTAALWTPSGVPGASDNAVVDTATGHSFTLSVTQANDAAHSLVVNSSIAKVEIVSGGVLTLGGNLTIDSGAFQIDSGGLLKQIATSSIVTGSFTNNGTVEVGPGDKLEIASTISGSGVFKIDAGATLQLDHGLSSFDSVTFSGSGTLVLEDPAHFNATVSDSTGSMTSSDVLDLIGFDTNASVTYNGNSSGGTVVITEAGHTTANIKVGVNSTHWAAPVSDGHGGILIHDPPADNSSPANVAGVTMNDPGPVARANDSITIGHDGVADLAAGSVAAVTFADATGHLTLEDATSSTIVISGFAGEGTLDGSDQIDIKGIDYSSHTFDENFDAAKGLLTVTDGNKSAALQFNGNYQAANFKFVSDGHGGTIVYDPPVANDAGQPNGFAVGQHGAAATSAGGDCFVFNLPGLQPIIQHAFEELQDTFAPFKDLLHILEHPDVAAGTSAFGQQHVPMGAVWIDTLKLATPHTDLHV